MSKILLNSKEKKRKKKRIELFVIVILKYKIILNVFPFNQPMTVYSNYLTQKCKLCSLGDNSLKLG